MTKIFRFHLLRPPPPPPLQPSPPHHHRTTPPPPLLRQVRYHVKYGGLHAALFRSYERVGSVLVQAFHSDGPGEYCGLESVSSPPPPLAAAEGGGGGGGGAVMALSAALEAVLRAPPVASKQIDLLWGQRVSEVSTEELEILGGNFTVAAIAAAAEPPAVTRGSSAPPGAASSSRTGGSNVTLDIIQSGCLVISFTVVASSPPREHNKVKILGWTLF